MNAREIIEQYAREQRLHIRQQNRANFYSQRTAKAKILQGRVEACETILARMTKEQA